MEDFKIAGLILISVTFIITFVGFTDKFYFLKNNFSVGGILKNKEYRRLLISGFLHLNWTHLIINMLTLYFFSQPIEIHLGIVALLIIYLGSLIGGNLLSLLIHKNQLHYTSVGAMGAVCGIIFSTLSIDPDYHIAFAGIGLKIPSWLYAIAFGVFCLTTITNKKYQNEGQDSHLGGAIIGLLLAVVIEPSILADHYIVIMLTLIPCIIFLYILFSRPLYQNGINELNEFPVTMDERYNRDKKIREQELNLILEKIHSKGIHSLSKLEKEKLEKYSQEIR